MLECPHCGNEQVRPIFLRENYDEGDCGLFYCELCKIKFNACPHCWFPAPELPKERKEAPTGEVWIKCSNSSCGMMYSIGSPVEGRHGWSDEGAEHLRTGSPLHQDGRSGRVDRMRDEFS